tara:strand:- start:124 stop:606 length:483 start_codon:yes stop_codon:yes gene_type:complete
MSIDAGFKSNGFVDDREEQERWGLIDKKLSEPKGSDTQKNSEETYVVDGKMEVSDDGNSDWVEDMQKSSIKQYKKKELSRKRNFFQRNKREIFDALVLLGIVYVGYKLFFEKEDGAEFDHGGEVDYTPTPQTMPSPVAEAPMAPAPPRPELPEATFNPEA